MCYNMALTMTKLPTHPKKKKKTQIMIFLKITLKPWKFWNKNVKKLENGQEFQHKTIIGTLGSIHK
jgi:hypothetical protein